MWFIAVLVWLWMGHIVRDLISIVTKLTWIIIASRVTGMILLVRLICTWNSETLSCVLFTHVIVTI